jgi:hypothetical protein
MAFGFLLTFLRARLRIPLHMPGHHGMEVMFLIMIARFYSRLPFSSSITTISAASCMLIPGLGYTDPFLPLIYIYFGLFLDGTFRLFSKQQANIFFVVLISGLAYSFIPLIRFLLVIFAHFPYTSILKGGFAMNFISHFVFGAIGGFLAIASFIIANKFKAGISKSF